MKPTEFTCDVCNRAFQSEESLTHHKRDRHDRVQQESVKREAEKVALAHQENTQKTVLYLKERTKKRKKALFMLIGLVALVAIIFIGYQITLSSQERKEELRLEGVPSDPIHWHPRLTIVINGETQVIPRDIGITQNVHYPVHTHEEDDGTVHMENDGPNSENVRLGYFFKVWGKTFNERCIFDSCINDTNELKMYVNGKENTQYERYIMRDKDEIKIEYGTKTGTS